MFSVSKAIYIDGEDGVQEKRKEVEMSSARD
jgi:hypothetical protein